MACGDWALSARSSSWMSTQSKPMVKDELEFAPPEAEFTPPGPEFTPIGEAEAPSDAQRGRHRIRRLAAAAACLVVLSAGVLGAKQAPAVPPVELTTVPTVTEAPPVTEPPTETVPPPTQPAPDVDAVLVQFSSKVAGRLLFSQPEAVNSISVTVWNTLLDQAEEEYTVPTDEIQSGEYSIPGFHLDDLYLANREKYDTNNSYPQVELRLSMEYTHDGNTESLQKTFLPKQEQGWSIQYYPQDLEASEYVYPGCFVLRTYSSTEKTEFITDESQPLLPGQMRLSAVLGDVTLSPETFQVLMREFPSLRMDDNGETVPGEMLYQTVVIIPKPEDLPEHLPETGYSTARFTVSQQLVHYDYLWSMETHVPY